MKKLSIHLFDYCQMCLIGQNDRNSNIFVHFREAGKRAKRAAKNVRMKIFLQILILLLSCVSGRTLYTHTTVVFFDLQIISKTILIYLNFVILVPSL